MLRVVFLSLLLAPVTVCEPTSPGAKVRLTQHAVKYANQLAQEKIIQETKTLVVPDQSGRNGSMYWTLKKIQVQEVTPPGSVISLTPGQNGITWALTNFSISMHSAWSVKYKKGITWIKDSGKVDISLTGLNVTETAAFGMDETGRPTIESKGCSGAVERVKVRFQGGQAFIINLFRHSVERNVKATLPFTICEKVVEIIDSAERGLANMNVTYEVAGSFILDYRLVTTPVISTDYLEVSDKGEFYWAADVKETPFSPKPIPPLTDNSRMIYIWVTDYTPNTFLYQGHTHHFFNYNITKKHLPPDQESFLNTSCFLKCVGKIVPQIGSQYPHSTVELDVQTAHVPDITLRTDKMAAQIGVLVDMWARTPSGSLAYLCTLAMNISLTLKPSIKGDNLTAVITDHSFHLAVVRSAIGTVHETVLNLVIRAVLNFVVVPRLNKMTQVGIELPIMEQVQLSNYSLMLQEGNLLIGADLHYNMSNTLRFHGKAKNERK